MNTSVSFELAKLLKEKRFNEPQSRGYLNGKIEEYTSKSTHDMCIDGYYLAPTIAEVVMWLYEKHGVWISVGVEPESGVFYFFVDKNKGDFFYDKGDDYDSPTEAYEAAIDYTLNHLI